MLTGNVAGIKLLLKNHSAKSERRALQYGDKESAVFMIKKGADYNYANNRGVTPAQIAVEKGYDTVLELMTDIQ